MPRRPDERADKAYELFGQGLKLTDIANQLGVPEGTVRSWKNRYKWDRNVADKRNVAKRKKGAQPGNHNAIGGPPGNKYAEKHGLFAKYLPAETMDIVNNMTLDPLDILWDNIQIAYAAIVRAQQLMYVKDRQDKTTTKVQEKNGDAVYEERWEVQQAWDKHASFLQAQARAQGELRSMIRQYDEMLHKNWDLATDEQRSRIAHIKAQTERLAYERPGADEDGVEIINDTQKASEDIGHSDPEVPADIQR